MLGNGFGDGCGFNLRIFGNAVIQTAQELAAGLRIELPGIFAVEDDRDNGVASGIEDRLSGVMDAAQHIFRCILCRNAGIDEADEVGERMIAEDNVHVRIVFLVAIDVVEPLDAAVGQASVAIAMEIRAD